MLDVLPPLKEIDSLNAFYQKNVKRLFVCSEGFEERSLSFVQNLKETKVFDVAIVCTYSPTKKSRMDELLPIVTLLTQNTPLIYEFNRFEPCPFEEKILQFAEGVNDFDEIIIDISVMSKLMIIILINCLKFYEKRLKIIYSQPDRYSPTIGEYNKNKSQISKSAVLPSFGVHDVTRTPLLSSVIMQRNSSLVVSFLSFNEQLIRSLLSFLSPTNLFLINGVPPILKWREMAAVEIHREIIKEYSFDNEVDVNGLLMRKTSTLFYGETFKLLADIYRNYCVSRRIIIAPTGSKLQAFACGLIKLCCPEIHFEYPTPESYYVEGFSSSNILKIYEIEFMNFKNEITQISEIYELNS